MCIRGVTFDFSSFFQTCQKILFTPRIRTVSLSEIYDIFYNAAHKNCSIIGIQSFEVNPHNTVLKTSIAFVRLL